MEYGSLAEGIDFNPVAIKKAAKIASHLGIKSKFAKRDLFLYKPKKRFDMVSSIGVLHHTNNCIAGLRHIFHNLVKPGGYAFIGLYHKYGRKPFLDYFDKLKMKGLNEDQLLEEFNVLFPGSDDKQHNLSWFYDQVLHPHETQHSLAELMPILHSEKMELVASSINKFELFRKEDELFEKEKQYYELAIQKIRKKIYFPGFFVFLAKKSC